MQLDRELVIGKIAKSLESVDYVNALWLEGADSLCAVDNYSDIDIWIDVKDGKENEVVDLIREILTSIGKLDFDFEKEHTHPKIRQHLFHIKDTPKFLLIDVCVQSNSRVFWFTNGMEGEKVNILFDKKNVINFREMDNKAFEKDLSERKEYLTKQFILMRTDTEKEINRNDYLGALNFYLELAITFTELLRIKYAPTKHEFGLKHSSKDLPDNLVDLLKQVYSFKSIKDLEQNIDLMSKNISLK